jgi:ferredoxin
MELPPGAQPAPARSRPYPARRPTRLGAWLAQARRDARVLLDGLRGVHPSPLLPRTSGRFDDLRAERPDLRAEQAGRDTLEQPLLEPQVRPDDDPTHEPAPGSAADPTPEPTREPPGGTRLLVHIDGRVHEVIVQPDQTILDAALAARLRMPFSCTLGACGACKVTLLDGAVDMEEPNCLRPRERASGRILTCVGRPLGPVTIEVDEE